MESSNEIYEFLRKLLMIRKGQARLLCGSSFELPIQYVIANATDFDIMYMPTDICARPLNVSEPRAFKGKTFLVNTQGSHPGFARLYLPDCKNMYHKQADIIDEPSRHTPAMTTMVTDSRHVDFVSLFENLGSSQYQELSVFARLPKMTFDRVFAIYCPCWPPEADEWKTRERSNGWPPKETIEKVIAGGCHLVAKTHQSNPSDETQWRFSFSQAELILIHSWTDVQKYVYHLLRVIKSEVVKACGGSDETVLCTYFFKTLMLWECERKPKEFWVDENVEKSVSDLLCIMIEYFIDGCCPNYFIPKYNMINALTERLDFTKEIQILLAFTQLNKIHQISAMWPKAYRKHMICQMQVAVPETLSLHFYLMQVRDNYLNPLYPNMKSRLLTQMMDMNSLLWHLASDLYRGIMSHLQFMKTRCPMERCSLKRLALGHFMSSQMTNENECSIWSMSIGESFYECSDRLIRATDCKFKSSQMPKDGRTCKPRDSTEMQFSSNRRQSPLSTSCNLSTHERFIRCYYRQEESEDNDTERTRTRNATVDNLNSSVTRLLQNFVAVAADYVDNATLVIHLVYLANFYYTALKDYEKASVLCDSIITFPEGCSSRNGNVDLSFYERAFPIYITNELASIFDENVRTVLGLITLHWSITPSFSESSAVFVRIYPAQFIKYLKIQCNRWTGAIEPEIRENFRRYHTFKGVYDTVEPLSEVFMSAVLRASRC